MLDLSFLLFLSLTSIIGYPGYQRTFLGRGGLLFGGRRPSPRVAKSREKTFRAGHNRDMTDTGNHGRKTSGTQGNNRCYWSKYVVFGKHVLFKSIVMSKSLVSFFKIILASFLLVLISFEYDLVILWRDFRTRRFNSRHTFRLWSLKDIFEKNTQVLVLYL